MNTGWRTRWGPVGMEAAGLVLRLISKAPPKNNLRAPWEKLEDQGSGVGQDGAGVGADTRIGSRRRSILVCENRSCP